MVKGVDRIVISVPELDSAVAEYRLLLSCSPSPPAPGSDPGSSCCFDLNNTRIELTATGQPGGISGLVLAAEGAPTVPTPVGNDRGLDIRLCGTAASGAAGSGATPSALRVDHLVLRSGDAEGCIELFSRQLGIRLALDQTVPEWGGRMLFFRTGKLTLEVIEPGSDAPARDHFWGIAYQCADIEQTGRLLAQAGVALSGIRTGRKPGTRVMTVKSHCLGIPTLLVEPGPT